MKYYFITYQATNKQGTRSVWNQVIRDSPMKFIKKVAQVEYSGSRTYVNFVVINTCEITEEEFLEYDGRF